MATIITIIVYLLLIGLVYYAVSLVPTPPPYNIFIRVMFIVLAVVVVLLGLGVIGGGLPHFRL